MDEKFPDEFVTWRHKTPIGVKVDEIFGMDSKSGKVWIELARQIYAEQGEHYYRVIDHFPSGAPFLEGYPGRISLTHTNHFMAVASIPKTPDIPLENFNVRTAMGIDAESLSRSQVLSIRNRFLSDKELAIIPENDLKKNIIAWTSKEALYKAALTPGINFKEDLVLITLPSLTDSNNNKAELGEALIKFQNSNQSFKMVLYSYESYDCCVTIAISLKCARFG